MKPLFFTLSVGAARTQRPFTLTCPFSHSAASAHAPSLRALPSAHLGAHLPVVASGSSPVLHLVGGKAAVADFVPVGSTSTVYAVRRFFCSVSSSMYANPLSP